MWAATDAGAYSPDYLLEVRQHDITSCPQPGSAILAPFELEIQSHSTRLGLHENL
jgi:hypothetical protein